MTTGTSDLSTEGRFHNAGGKDHISYCWIYFYFPTHLQGLGWRENAIFDLGAGLSSHGSQYGKLWRAGEGHPWCRKGEILHPGFPLSPSHPFLTELL